MSRTLWGIGGLGSLVAVAALVTGFLLRSVHDEGMPRHVLIALAGTLIASFCHLWAGVYLWGLSRAVAATAAEGGLEGGAVAAVRRLRARGLRWIVPALVLTLGLFALGGPALTGALPPLAHQALAWGALGAQGMALWTERQVLTAAEGLLRSATEPRS